MKIPGRNRITVLCVCGLIALVCGVAILFPTLWWDKIGFSIRQWMISFVTISMIASIYIPTLLFTDGSDLDARNMTDSMTCGSAYAVMGLCFMAYLFFFEGAGIGQSNAKKAYWFEVAALVGFATGVWKSSDILSRSALTIGRLYRSFGAGVIVGAAWFTISAVFIYWPRGGPREAAAAVIYGLQLAVIAIPFTGLMAILLTTLNRIVRKRHLTPF